MELRPQLIAVNNKYFKIVFFTAPRLRHLLFTVSPRFRTYFFIVTPRFRKYFLLSPLVFTHIFLLSSLWMLIISLTLFVKLKRNKRRTKDVYRFR